MPIEKNPERVTKDDLLKEELIDRMRRQVEAVHFSRDESPEAVAEAVKILAVLKGADPRASLSEALEHLFHETVLYDDAEHLRHRLDEAKDAIEAINDRVDTSKGFAVLRLLNLEIGTLMGENEDLDESLLGLLEEFITLIKKISERSFETLLTKGNIHIPPKTVTAMAALARKVSDELALVTDRYPRSLEMSRLALYLEGLVKNQA